MISTLGGTSLFEGLEMRRLFTAFPTNPGYWLDLTGTNHADHIDIGYSKDHQQVNVSINGHHKLYPVGTIQVVLIHAKAGDDVVRADESNGKILCQIQIYGGRGNDTLIGGSGPDTILGEDGNDLVEGGAGGDQVSGGNGDDTLVGGAGNDYLVGNDGNDRLNGGDGNDILDGDNGHDICYGGSGSDVMMFGDNMKEFRDKTANDAKDDATYYDANDRGTVLDGKV